MPMGWYALDANPPYPVSMGEWSMALRPYVNLNNNVCLCPLATTFRSSLGNNLWVANNTQNLAWGIMGSNQYPVLNWGAPGLYGSYGINGWMYNPPLSAEPEGSNPLYWRKLSAAGPSHNIPVFSDCDYDGSQPSDTDSPPPSPGYQSVTDDMSNFAIPRHEGGRPVNVAFMDSSVSPTGLKQLWRFNWSTDFDTTYQDKLNQWPVWMRSYQ
jgi:prepilin-type processing-associated H-X9-DG protein